MCGRFHGLMTLKAVKDYFSASPIANLPETGSYNTAPTESAYIVTEDAQGERLIRAARFGMMMTAGGKSFPLINLQSEKAANRKDFQTRRCIVPMAGFYEWEKLGPKDRQPYYFSPKEGIFAAAAVWNSGPEGLSFSILTTAANDVVAPIHSRMPVMLSHNASGEWLAATANRDTLSGLMQSYPANLMQSWKVSKEVNNPRNKQPGCINSL